MFLLFSFLIIFNPTLYLIVLWHVNLNHYEMIIVGKFLIKNKNYNFAFLHLYYKKKRLYLSKKKNEGLNKFLYLFKPSLVFLLFAEKTFSNKTLFPFKCNNLYTERERERDI
jgi:hypothetical protein